MELRCDVHDLDIVCITETWLDESIPDDQLYTATGRF